MEFLYGIIGFFLGKERAYWGDMNIRDLKDRMLDPVYIREFYLNKSPANPPEKK